MLGLDLPVDEWAKEEGIADEEMLARIERRADEHMASKVAQWGADTMRMVEKTDRCCRRSTICGASIS